MIASTTATEQNKMFNVTITYKSGKIENTKIKISEYSEALKQLVAEQRMVSIEITGVE
jgi:hypothetical protein